MDTNEDFCPEFPGVRIDGGDDGVIIVTLPDGILWTVGNEPGPGVELSTRIDKFLAARGYINMDGWEGDFAAFQR